MEKTKLTLYCELCDYSTDRNFDWLKHIQTKKHIRNGQPKETCCDKCDYKTDKHWLLQRHILTNHSTPEEKAKTKYYCSLCDCVFFCKKYLDNHLSGKHHQSRLKVSQSINDLKEKIEQLKNNNL